MLHLSDASSSSASTSHSQSNPRRSSRSTTSIHHKKPAQDVIGFMAGLNVNMEVIASIAQEIISLYTLWERYKEDGTDSTARGSFGGQSTSYAGIKRTASGAPRSNSVFSGGTSSSRSGTPVAEDIGCRSYAQRSTYERPTVITPTFLTQQLLKMREARIGDMAHPATGRPAVYDKRLERTQAVG